jgi:hypothetical protein
MDIDARAFGQLEGQVLALTAMMTAQNIALAKQNDEIAKIAKTVNEMSSTMSEARGGWKTLAWLGGISVTAGGFMTWIATHFKFSP